MSTTEEELLKLLEEAPDVEVDIDGHTNTVVPFILRYNIKEGEHRVTSNLIYKLYKAYTKDPLPKREFTRIFKDYFVEHMTGSTRYYMLNEPAIRVSDWHLKLLKKQPKRDRTKNPKYIENFQSFLRTHGIEKGNTWVEGFVLYEVYKQKYRKQHTKPMLSYNVFYKLLNLSFESKRLTENRGAWFGVNDSFKKYISDKEIEKVRKSRTKTGRSPKKKKTWTGE